MYLPLIRRRINVNILWYFERIIGVINTFNGCGGL